jgi:hypothetical protein
MEGGWKRLSCLARNGGGPGSPLVEWGGRRQGKKVADGRCGKTIEAQPLPGQTCLIEPAEDAAWDSGGRNMMMATNPT